ncbi:MAG TPA: hypothetical protein PKB06_12185 [Actinotalea sp.]|nr:hypothetical protein [Actinotalea sp.]
MTSTTEDAHWAPPQLVVGRRLLTHVGHLQVTWSRGLGRSAGAVEPDRQLPATPAVFALVEHGSVRYVGTTDNLARTFGPRGAGRTRDESDPRRAEAVRLHHLVLATAAAGRVVDLYLLGELGRPRPWWRRDRRVPAHDLAAEASALIEVTHGSWQR